MKCPSGLCMVCLKPAEAGKRYCVEHRRRPKYRAVRTEATIEGRKVKFDSRKEEKRFAELVLLERAGLISLLSRQPRFRLVVNGALVCCYVGDSQYFDIRLGMMVVEDAKGVRTRAYRIKAKLFTALTGIQITEV